MKTQLIISSLFLTAALFISINSKAESDSTAKKMPAEISVASELFKTDVINEGNFEIQGWMLDDNLWKLSSTKIVSNEPENEETLSIESWMTSDSYFRIPNDVIKAKDSESPLCIQKWMTDTNYWRF